MSVSVSDDLLGGESSTFAPQDSLNGFYDQTVSSEHLRLLFLVSSLLFCLVPCDRLSWLFVSFWAHINIVYRIVSLHSV